MYVKYIKRMMDILMSLAVMPLVLVIIVTCGFLIKLEDGGPVFYCAQRLGRNGRIFLMYKLRTMKVNSPDIRVSDGSTWNSGNDPRVTKVGRVLRKTSLDEVPQFINVLKADMSLIGPRPDPPDWLERYSTEERVLLSVLPGITGYNQAYFRNSADGKKKTINDVYYAKNISFFFDVKILIKTIACVVKRKNIYTSQQPQMQQKNSITTGRE